MYTSLKQALDYKTYVFDIVFVRGMSFIRTFQLVLTIFALASYPCRAELTYTVAYIKDLLKEGKSVAILLIDMQTSFFPRFVGPEVHEIVHDQASLIEQLSQEKNLYFIDVHLKRGGKTLAKLHFQLKESINLSLLTKKQANAFKKGEVKIKDTFTLDEESRTPMPTDLTSYLREKGIQDVVITGCFDRRCVRATTIAAAEENFHTVVDRDLNIILDKEDFQMFSTFSRHTFLAKSQEMWDKLRERYPNLIVFDPVRYGNCELKED